MNSTDVLGCSGDNIINIIIAYGPPGIPGVVFVVIIQNILIPHMYIIIVNEFNIFIPHGSRVRYPFVNKPI